MDDIHLRPSAEFVRGVAYEKYDCAHIAMVTVRENHTPNAHLGEGVRSIVMHGRTGGREPVGAWLEEWFENCVALLLKHIGQGDPTNSDQRRQRSCSNTNWIT